MEQNNEITRSKIRSVFLSDLHLVKSIYKETHSNISEDFGLPLALAHYGKEVIGYASLTFNSSHEPEIHHFLKKGFEQEVTKLSLDEYAQNILYSMLDYGNQDHSTLEILVKRFINWLN